MKGKQADPNFVSLETLTSNGRDRYWRSLEELGRTPEFEDLLHTEFLPNATEFTDEVSRRRFLQLAAASLGLAGMTACTRQPIEKIMPYVDPPENALPGVPLYFASAVPVAGIAEGVLVESHLGRPTKIEGNPDHPASLGATSVQAQASVLDLYDPDRAQQISELGVWKRWEDFQIVLGSDLTPLLQKKGAGVRILTETITSPVLGAQIHAFLDQFPEARWHQWDAAGPHSARAGSMMAFGRYVNTYYRFENASVVVSLDSDFLASDGPSTRYARDFANRRTRGDRTDMNRLYSIESSMTATGGKADHRLPLRYADIELFARDLAANVGTAGVAESGSRIYPEVISAIARDLTSHRGDCIVVPGSHQPAVVHALAHAINAALGNVGKTVFYTDPLEVQAVDQLASLRDLASDMEAGSVEFLMIFGGNPLYDAPADFEFANRLQKVKTSVHVALHSNETSVQCRWHMPQSHFLEDWSDARAYDGTITILQPLILPLYDSRTAEQVLDAILKPPGRSQYEIVRAYWQGKSGAGNFEQWWRKSVHDGLVPNSALPTITPNLKTAWAAQLPASRSDGMELVFRPDPYLYDGRYANNTWLQELPQPMTKLTWDNAVHVSPVTAQHLKLRNQGRVQLESQGRSVEASIWVSPGHPDESATVHLGWGRWHAGRAGTGAGFNAYALRQSATLWSAPGVQIRKIDKDYPLATTQMHQSMEGRNLIISDDVTRYKGEPDFVEHEIDTPPKDLTLYPQWNYTGYAWGMSIDLTRCVNCNACVVACQAENNIPVVGKQQVLARRAMPWLRIDTYYKGDLSNPQAYYQPVPCMQCEDAPCELVCPVQATNHSSDGLNDMVYNRCVGTRYCSNNCPYKVRRFNFMLFQDWVTESIKLQRNPDVTVRSRGVMEKCTYCVQRIREADIRSRVEDRFINDGEVQTACQQACPTQAIIFGDINNRNNRVAKLKSEKLNYALLAELNTRPRTTYLAELRNLNPELKSKS